MKFLSKLLGMLLILSFTAACAGKELRNRNAELERRNDALEQNVKDLKGSLDDAGGIKDLKANLDSLNAKINDLDKKVDGIADSNSAIASKMSSRSSADSHSSAPKSNGGSGKGGKYTLRLLSAKNNSENAKKLNNYVAFLKRKGYASIARPTLDKKWLVIESGSFDSMRSSSAKSYQSKVRNLSYYGKKMFATAIFRTK